ncbi:MAG: DUF1501 domain-containing protein [Pseudomonadota bacterium]
MANRLSRRDVLKTAGALPLLGLGPLAAVRAADASNERILVVVELSGGNDGLNTVVPHGDDAYYRLRPNLGIAKEQLLPIDDHFGFNPGMLGFKRLWDSGDLAIVHGCGYDNPSFSHFTSMAYWHTAAPNSGAADGWVGRLADAMLPEAHSNAIINIGARQSLAVKANQHVPVVFDDPARFQRRAFRAAQPLLNRTGTAGSGNATREYLNGVARSAVDASARVRAAWADYDTNVDYGLAPLDLDKVAACIAADLPTPLYYVSFRNNAFDTHVQQANLHRRLLSYACDAIHGFIQDLKRLGVDDRVAVLVFSEFGRRVPENANLGTDHGAANVMFMAGAPVRQGHYGEVPNLEQLDDGDNLIAGVDFRRVYATAIDEWIAPGKAGTVLKDSYEPLGVFA